MALGGGAEAAMRGAMHVDAVLMVQNRFGHSPTPAQVAAHTGRLTTMRIRLERVLCEGMRTREPNEAGGRYRTGAAVPEMVRGAQCACKTPITLAAFPVEPTSLMQWLGFRLCHFRTIRCLLRG